MAWSHYLLPRLHSSGIRLQSSTTAKSAVIARFWQDNRASHLQRKHNSSYHKTRRAIVTKDVHNRTVRGLEQRYLPGQRDIYDVEAAGPHSLEGQLARCGNGQCE